MMLNKLKKFARANAPKPVSCMKFSRNMRARRFCLTFLFFLFGLVGLLSTNNVLLFRSKIDPCVLLEESTPRKPQSTLPKIIHQAWKNDLLPERNKAWRSTWQRTFPHHQHILWTDEKIYRLLSEDFPWFLPIFNSLPKVIMKVDVARTFILYKYGGLYADMDYEVLADFWDRLPDDAPAVVQSYWSESEKTQNSLMTSPINNPFWNITWKIIEERAKDGSDDILWVGGPRMIDEAIARYQDKVMILPCENWQRVTWGEQPIKLRLQRAYYYYSGYFRECGDINGRNCVLTIHHGTTTWI